MKTSVLVIAHNEEKYIEKCIVSLLQQTEPADEIVLVVHNSTDQTKEIAEKYPIRIIPYNGPKGIVYARLEGLKHVSGDIILCTDGDSYVANNWCRVMKQTLTDGGVLAGSWVSFSGNLFSYIANVFNKINYVKTQKPERWVWGASFIFWGKDKDLVKEIWERSIVLTSELKLSRNPDDYWLALFMKKQGKISVTNKTYVVSHSKEKNSIEIVKRNIKNIHNGNIMEKYFKKITIDTAAQKVWDYLVMHHPLKKADVIFVLGNRDTRVAEYAAQLYLDDWAPVLLIAGSGSIHNHKPGRERFVGTTEAEVFADIAIKAGVPESAIIIENESQNTSQNYEFALKKLNERGIKSTCMILVQKPYLERRTYATGKVWLENIELIVTSPQIPFEKYPIKGRSKEQVIHAMIGELQRIKEYPKRGFQIEQDIPDDVWHAYEYLIEQGYTERMIIE